MPVDMNPPLENRLQLAREALSNAKTDWYRIKLNQPDDESGQKENLLRLQEERAELILAEIDALSAEVEEADAKAAKEEKAAAAKAEKEDK